MQHTAHARDTEPEERDSEPAAAQSGAVAAPQATLEQFRAALGAGNTGVVRELLSFEPRDPAELDLLVEMVSRDGLDAAVQRLCRFWSRAESTLVHARPIHEGECELYERVRHAATTVPSLLVTLLRREAGRWRVVSTTDAPDDALEAAVLRTVPPEQAPSDSAWTRAWIAENGPTAELIVDGCDGWLGWASRGWLAELRVMAGDTAERSMWLPPRARSEIAAAPSVLRVRMAGSPDAATRLAQVDWFTRVVTALAAADAGAVYVRATDRLVPVAELRSMTPGAALGAHALETGLWVRLRIAPGFLHTQGMTRLALPELETAQRLQGPGARQLLSIATQQALISHGARADRDRVIIAGEHRYRLLPGRRGPRPGRSYGAWGALEVEMV